MGVYVYSTSSQRELSQRQQEAFDKYTKVLQWGRGHPVEFGARFMGFDLYDYQKLMIYHTWFSTFSVWLVCRDGAKTYGMGMYTMLRSVLLPNHVSYFLGNTGEQSKEVFKKIEKIAKREISSAVGLTDVFINELERQGATSDGFIHNPASFSMKLFNGSEIYTLNSDIINIKGKRANFVAFDESGWMSDELFLQAEHFTDQSEQAILGAGVNPELEPPAFPRQILYASSASDTDSEFYKKFKNASTRMMMGDRRYWACNYTIDTIMSAKKDGESYPSLISQDKVDQAMLNPEKGMRELYNKFTTDTHEGQIVTRRNLMNVTEPKVPELAYSKGKQYIIAWDSARLNDNSTVGIASVYEDPETGWNMDIVNCVNFVDVKTKNKTPMRMPDQVETFKSLLLDYNGTEFGALDYENIKAVICDSGAGGQMIGGISDYLLQDWEDKKGHKHRGVIDSEHKANETAVMEFPDAVDIMHLVDPRAHRNEIFDAAERMTKLGVVHFPAEYEGKDFFTVIGDDGEDNTVQLTFDEQAAMAQISRMKDELVLMCKYVSGGTVSYNFPPDKRNKEHDDRAFTYSLLCWYLAKLRRNDQRVNTANDDIDVASMILTRKPSYLKK
ncbi:MAG: terminase [Clostridia bacterium]|nr:terminase [Clostridia bacterium]